MKHKKSVYTTFALISQLGISMIVPVFLCTFVGMKLDEKFSTSVTIPMIILGILAGARNVYALVRQATAVMESEEDEDDYWKIRKQIDNSRIEEEKLDEEE